MPSDLPPGMGGFFPGMLNDLLRLLKSDAPLQWELCVQLAETIAAEEAAPGNADPLARIRLEELVRIAELQVGDVTGMTTTPDGRPLSTVATTRPDFARRALTAWRGFLERFAEAMRAPGREEPPGAEAADLEALFAGAGAPGGEESDERDLAAFFSKWVAAVAPAMIAMQVGSVVGHLARRSLGQYELLIPWGGSELVAVVDNARTFAEDWSLPADDVLLFVAVRDVATQALLSRPHVRTRLEDLLVARARGFRPNPEALESHFGELGQGGDVTELARLFSDPSTFGDLVDSPGLRRTEAELSALTAVVLGYVGWASDEVAKRTVAARSPIAEALRRRRIEASEEDRAGGALFGLSGAPEAEERGAAFVRGVLDRGGHSELAKLFVVEANLPTPAEVDAPGLWIERVNLPADLSE